MRRDDARVRNGRLKPVRPPGNRNRGPAAERPRTLRCSRNRSAPQHGGNATGERPRQAAQERAAQWRPEAVPSPGAGQVPATLEPAPASVAGAEATEPPPSSLSREEIREAQDLLEMLGYAPGAADGRWGPRSSRAYMAFLRDASLPIGESLSEEGLEAIREAVPVAHLKPKCGDAAEVRKCWRELANRPGCYAWEYTYDPHETLTWSGKCAGGLAVGQGILTWIKDGQTDEGTGTIINGKRQRHWAYRWADGGTWEGSHVDGKIHGYWVERSADGTVREGFTD